MQRDDGAVIYLNGREVWRSNLPGGAIDYLTEALNPISGSAEQQFLEDAVPIEALQQGANLVAAEVHQSGGSSSDLGFDFELEAVGLPPAVRLRIELADPFLRLSWPAALTGYDLQSAAMLGGEEAWSTVEAPIVVIEDRRTAVLSLQDTSRFFRLIRSE